MGRRVRKSKNTLFLSLTWLVIILLVAWQGHLNSVNIPSVIGPSEQWSDSHHQSDDYTLSTVSSRSSVCWNNFACILRHLTDPSWMTNSSCLNETEFSRINQSSSKVSMKVKKEKLEYKLGNRGQAIIVDRNRLTPEEQQLYDEGWKNHAFNQFVSDLIGSQRQLPDDREGMCKEQIDTSKLLPTAIIICFYNECWSTLLRSVHSVLDNTPPELLQEILLVDDASTHDYLKKPLDEYFAHFDKVKVIHTDKREGLIRARLIGANATRAPVLTYLDSHIECTKGWLEPLLDCIRLDKHNVVSPIIDVINEDTFQYHFTGYNDVQIGGFDWELTFHWNKVPDRVLTRYGAPYTPMRTPTIAGGLFSIHRDFFAHLGYYDPEYSLWGAENFELSFKTWMCGGTLLIHPCSHVGHVFRKRTPYVDNGNMRINLRRNLQRLVEVWLDDYKYYYYERFNIKPTDNLEDVSERKALRNKLQCKSFQWYLDTIYPELPTLSTDYKVGDIENQVHPICLDASVKDDSPQLHILRGYPCHRTGGNQVWYLTSENRMRRDDKCWTVDNETKYIHLKLCDDDSAQEFHYTEDGTLIHDGLCLQIDNNLEDVYLQQCRDTSNQQWLFPNVRHSLSSLSFSHKVSHVDSQL